MHIGTNYLAVTQITDLYRHQMPTFADPNNTIVYLDM